jgi:release factor glutamine methyltransferase
VNRLTELRGEDEQVYQPAEDSHLLAAAAAGEIDAGDLVLDVGTGSGYVGGHVARETGAHVIGSDVNPYAVRQARDAGLEVVLADLVAPFRDGVFDAVTFNPPYLPTDPEEAGDDWMEVALSGGESGRAVVEPFLAAVGRVLAPDGVILLLVSTLAGVDEVAELAGEEGFSTVVVAEESFPFETLVVAKLLPAMSDSNQND